MRSEKSPVQMVADYAYHAAIGHCATGDRVDVEPDPDKPDDMLALVVKVRGETIGYIAPESWLIDAVHVDDKIIKARISSIEYGQDAVSVWLKVSVSSRRGWARYWRAARFSQSARS